MSENDAVHASSAGFSSGVYEIVRGQIRLSHRQKFFELHRNRLMPMLSAAGIEPVVLLVSEIGPYGRFLDIYRFASMQDYDARTSAFLGRPDIGDYYEAVGQCIVGSIDIELATEIPGTAEFIGRKTPA